MAAAARGHGSSSTCGTGGRHAAALRTTARAWSQSGPLHTLTSSRPQLVELQSISTHVPLHSIALAPDTEGVRAVQQQQQQARVPFWAAAAADRQMDGLVLLRQQQQLNSLQQQQQQDHLLPLARLGAAAAGRKQLPREETAQLLQGVGPLLPELSAPQLALAAWGASMLPHGAATLSACDGWQQALLAAAAQHFAAGTMCDASAAKLLQALVKLQAQPGAAWLAAACRGMAVSGWSDPRSLSTVAACLPQLGHAPSSSWARAFYAAAGARLAAFPATSLARMLQGVVAWQQLQHHQQQQPDVGGGQEQLPPPPEPWLTGVLQQLHARSGELRPPEVALVLAALSRLQQQAVAAARQGQPSSASSSSSYQHGVLPPPGRQADSPLQLLGQQLLHALLPAVVQQLQFFSGHDLAAVLYALVQLQLQQDQEQQQDWEQHDAATCEPRCTWQWLRQVLAAAQDGLHGCDARTQVTTLFAAATLIAPHLEQQEQQQQQARVQALQQELGLPGAADAAAAAHAPAAAPRQLTQATRAPGWSVLVRPVRPTQPEHQAWQQAVAAAGISSAVETQEHETAARGVWRGWLDAFCVASLPLLPTFSCQDLVQASCTLAGQRQAPDAAWYEQLLAAVQQRLPTMTPGQVAGVAWALARMALLPCQHNPAVSLVPLQPWLARLYCYSGVPIGDAARQRAAPGPCRSSRPAELARLMWAAGVCDFDPGPAWWTAAEQQLEAHAPAAAASAGRQSQPVLPARLLGAMAQAYEAAGRTMPPALLQQLVVQAGVCRQLPREPVVNTLRLLRGLSRAGSALPQQWLQQLAAGFQHRLAQLEPAELPQLVLCLADAGLQLQEDDAGTAADVPDSKSSSWQLDCVTATQRLAPHMAAHDASLMLWGAAKLRLRLPPATIEALVLRLQAGFLEAPPAALAQGIDALSRLGHTPSSDWLGAFLMATHRRYTAAAGAAAAAVQDADSMSSMGTSIRGRLALAAAIVQTLWGLARLRTPVQPRWLKHQLLLLHAQLPLLQPRHIAGLLLALAKLKCRPGAAYLQHMLQQLGDCSSCSALDLVHVAYACACLRWRPSPAWMRVFLAAAAAKLPHMTPQGLALLHWALAVVRVVPPHHWRSRSVAVVAARVGQLDALQLSMVVWAWGRMRVYLTPSHAALLAAGGDSSGGAVARVLATRTLQQRRRRLAEQLLSRAWQLRGQFSAAALAHCLAGVATMQLTPSQDWLHGMVARGSCEALISLDGYRTQQLLRALARLRYRAPQAWVEQMGLLAETKSSQQHDGTRNSAEWALAQLRALALPAALGDARRCA